jgi:hypothetical protein
MTTTAGRLRPLSATVVLALGYGEAAGGLLSVLAVGAPHAGIVAGGVVGLIGAAVVNSPVLESPDVSDSSPRGGARVWRWLGAGLVGNLVAGAYGIAVRASTFGVMDDTPHEPVPAASFGLLALIALVSLACLARGLALAVPGTVRWRSPFFVVVALAAAFAAVTAVTSGVAFFGG